MPYPNAAQRGELSVNSRSRDAEFAPGFRCSKFDMFVLIVGTLSLVALWPYIAWLAFVVGFVTAHFFLFCNVVRMSRPLELIWASIFVVGAGCTVILDEPGWSVTAAISIAAAIVLTIVEMRRPSFHGIGWRTINPNLEKWWSEQEPRS